MERRAPASPVRRRRLHPDPPRRPRFPVPGRIPRRGGRGSRGPGDVGALQQARREVERLEINSHVVHTYNFLVRIPWSRTLRDVPEIAGAHHEKLDGTGYPWGVRGNELTPAARILCVADIYDALTSDRPYRAALTHEVGMQVLRAEAGGRLDAAVVQEMDAHPRY